MWRGPDTPGITRVDEKSARPLASERGAFGSKVVYSKADSGLAAIGAVLNGKSVRRARLEP
jgi:hypothetical protein